MCGLGLPTIRGFRDFFYKDNDKDDILVDNILGILLDDIFRQPILQRIRIKDILRIFKDKDID